MLAYSSVLSSCILFKIVTILLPLEGRKKDARKVGRSSFNTVLTLPGSHSDLHGLCVYDPLLG